MFEHRVGLFNASDAEPLTHVRIHLVDMSPLPRHRLNNYEEPIFPYGLPMASDGDKSIGITLPPGREELWILGYTSTGSDGSLNAGRFVSPEGRWLGLPWQLDADERCRLCYEVVCDDHGPVAVQCSSVRRRRQFALPPREVEHHAATPPKRLVLTDPVNPEGRTLLLDAIRACSHARSTHRWRTPTSR